MSIQPPGEAVVLAARHLDPTEGRGREGNILTTSDVAAINTVLRYIAKARNTQAETSQRPSRDTRADAIGYAVAWAASADRYAAEHRDADRPSERGPNLARIQRLAELGSVARETATMWASIARLLPAVLDEQQLLRQPDETPKPDKQCRSRHDFGPNGYNARCDRQHGHRGIHTTGGFQWSNTDRANAAHTTSLPNQRHGADDTSSSEPTPTTGTRSGCCQQAIVDAAKTLRHHARTAPGITAYERRCLEDAVDFVTHHATKAQPAPEREAPCDRWIAAEAHPAHTFRDIDGPVRFPGVEPGGKGGQS